MVTTLLTTLLQVADALSYDVQSDAPVIVLVDELDVSKRFVFDEANTHEANLRAAIRWCQAYNSPQTY